MTRGDSDDPRLNDRQREFIGFQEGCAVLHAPVGTGKTLALAERAAEAIRRGVPPSRILCLTFTNRAADELRQRIARHCGAKARPLVVCTFHGLCAWMIRTEAKDIGLPADFAIFDEEDSVEMVSEIIREAGLDQDRHRRLIDPRELSSRIGQVKVDAPEHVLTTGEVPDEIFAGFDPVERRIAALYQRRLAAHHALDFSDLIFYARAMLETVPDIRRRWEQRFSMIQVDEMQDTHLSEYLVLRALAWRCRNLVLAGDFDQTIYEWRGSTPDEVLRHFRSDFPEARAFSFVENYRSTRTLLETAACVASCYSRREPPRPTPSAPEGDPVVVHFAASSEAEAEWIAAKVKSLLRGGAGAPGEPLRYGRIGVLVRPNHRGATISEAFTRHGIPHLTVEAFEFFRRQEVKDAVAYLRFLMNPADGRSFFRMLMRPRRGIGERTIERVRAAEGAGLRLVDMVAPSTLKTGDPFGKLLEEFSGGAITVFDTETTGLNPGRDEIIELAAVRLERGKPAAEFHRYLRNTVGVGNSELVHGISDSFLAENGEDPEKAILEFLAFASGSLLVGHNVSFDVRMLTAYARRLGIPVRIRDFADTLEIARRFVDSDDFSLEGLADFFGLPARPSHRAIDDVKATCHLLVELVPLAARGAAHRISVVKENVGPFVRLAAELELMKNELGRMRPPALLRLVLEESGLSDFYRDEPRRIENLAELLRIFEERDDAELDPVSSLESTLSFIALARNVDRLDPADERVKVLTVHQSKGLEFDVVFVAGLSENEFPGWLAKRDNRLSEELRVFYVAVTRAKRLLILTGHAFHNGKRREPSRYFGMIGDRWIEEGSSAISAWLRGWTGRARW